MSSSGESVPPSAWSGWSTEAADQPVQTPVKVRRGRAFLGLIALGLAGVGLIVEIVAIGIAAPASATETSWAVASVLAWIANALTALAVVAGLIAVVARLGRWWGAPAIVVGLLANPWLQVTVLGALA